MNLKALLGDLPVVVQYIAVVGIIMLILYLCLMLTRFLGENHGKKYKFDDNDQNDQSVPDLFASTLFKRKKKKTPDESDSSDPKDSSKQ